MSETSETGETGETGEASTTTERPDAVSDAQIDAGVIGSQVARALERQRPELRAIWLVALADQLLIRLRHLGYEEVVEEASGLTEMDVYGYPGGSKAEFIAGDPGRTEPEVEVQPLSEQDESRWRDRLGWPLYRDETPTRVVMQFIAALDAARAELERKEAEAAVRQKAFNTWMRTVKLDLEDGAFWIECDHAALDALRVVMENPQQAGAALLERVRQSESVAAEAVKWVHGHGNGPELVAAVEAYEHHQGTGAIGEEKLEPRKSLYGLWADLGPAPSEEDIDQMRREVWGGVGEPRRMLCRIVREHGDDAFRECATVNELYDFLTETQQASGLGGAYYYDARPDTAEDGTRVLCFDEIYEGNDE